MIGRIEELEADTKMKSAYCGELQAIVSEWNKKIKALEETIKSSNQNTD